MEAPRVTPSLGINVPELVADRYRILREQGRGASGVVFQAEDVHEHQLVALKLLHPQSEADPDRLLQEAAALQQISHASIVRILASGMLDERRAWLAMEWLEGEPLDLRLRRSPLSTVESLGLAAQIAEALQATHSVGIVHRDIKPANVFLTQRDNHPLPKLLDFGSATHLDQRRLADSPITGTPAYMAPEQVRGDVSVDARCDLYSLGATLYEMLSGEPPHRGPTHLATLARLVTTRPRRLRELRPGLPAVLDDFVLTLLASVPEERPESAELVAQRLRELATEITAGGLLDTEPGSIRLGSSASRMLTTIVALDFPSSAARDQALPSLSTRGVDAVPLARDSLVAHLGARKAHGNEATSALRLGQRLARAGARVGVATGRALVPYIDLDTPPIGEVVDRATSLAGHASGGQLLADATTTELGRGRYEFVMRADGSAVIKGKLTATRIDAAGGTPFVGRNAELQRLRAGFERALTESRSVVISISGAPGIGKTRLQREAIARLSARSLVGRIVHQRDEAYARRRALGAAADIVRSLLSLPKGADADACRLAIQDHSQTLKKTPTHQVDILIRLLSGDPLQGDDDGRDLRDVLWRLMTQVVGASLRAGPVLLVAEDLQWTDPESVAWLEHLASRFEGRPLILLFTARPSFWQEHDQRFKAAAHVRIDLHPISTTATRAIASAVVGKALTPEAEKRIVEQAAGSPLFAEELSRLAAAGRNIELAPTIEAAIQASLDTLSEEQRETLNHIAVLGNAGWDEALEAFGLDDPERTLTELCASEVLVEQDNSRYFGLREWHFKHALVRDVAYNSMPDDQKKHLHGLAAQWFESLQDDAAIIARHYDLAGQPERAAAHWARAAQRALATNALSDALTLSERALAFAADGAEAFERARLLDEAWSRHDDRASDRDSAILAMEEHAHDETTRVYAAGARARYDAARGQEGDIDRRLSHTIAAARRLGLSDEEARCAAELARRLAFAGDFQRAEAEASRLLELSQQEGMRAAAVDAWQTLAIVHQSQGAIAPALDARRSAVAAAQNADLTERESTLTTNLGFALTTVGARREAREHLNQGLQLAEEIGSLGARRHALMLLLCWAATFGSDRELDASLGEVREEVDEAAGSLWTAPARENLGNMYYRGVELLRIGKSRSAERARNLLRAASQAYRETVNHDVLPVALGMWARAELLCGDRDGAARLANEAAELLESGAPSLLNESIVYLVLHDAEVERGNLEAAQAAVRRGMPALLRRTRGLATTPYVNSFLTELADNATLVAHAEQYGVLPEKLREVLGRDAG